MHSGPALKSGVVMDNGRQTKEIKRQVANNSVGSTRDLGASQGSSLPHSQRESLFQSVHTHPPFFHQPPSHTPIHPQTAAKGSFWNPSATKLHIPPCYVNPSIVIVRPSFQSKVNTDQLLVGLLPLPYSSPLTSNRQPGRSVVFAMLFFPTWPGHNSLFLVLISTPFTSPLK